MPKLKTLKSAQKRIRITKTGKAKYARATRGHLLTSKRSKRKRHLGRPGYLPEGERKKMQRILPYGA